MTKNMTGVNSDLQRSTAPQKRQASKPRKPKPAPAPRHVLDIGKAISLELTLALYEITPNAAAIELIGGTNE